MDFSIDFEVFLLMSLVNDGQNRAKHLDTIFNRLRNSTVQLVMCISLSSIFLRERYAVQHLNSSTLALVNHSESEGFELDYRN